MHCALESPKVCAPDLPGVGDGDQQRTSDPQSCQEIDVCFKATKLVVICYKPQNKTVIYVPPRSGLEPEENCYCRNHRQSQPGRRLWLVETHATEETERD